MKNFFLKIKSLFKTEPVLCISALAALISCCLVPPDKNYLHYVDIRTIALLYCLMVVVSGFRKAGVFEALGSSLCARAKNGRRLGFTLVLLSFFSSMLITNDVALLTFVPFTVIVLGSEARPALMIKLTVLETLAANMGSMLTPVGNPQNLYLYSRYELPLSDFVCLTAPVCAAALLLVCLLCLFLPKTALAVPKNTVAAIKKRSLILSCALFALCLLVVLRIIEWYMALPALLLALLIFDRSLLREADFLLLVTFVCFFVFVGNVGRLEGVNRLLSGLVKGRELIAGAAISQVISNVPAAVLLSGFTENGRALLLGVDIGGLGTPVASLASLISLKIYSATPEAAPGRYLALFSAVGFALLAVLLTFATFLVL